ncbi:MAG: hypothetical protein E7536_03815 [Ruminococcaceae bacterium]|nr:hypothetical protein [Oscillospiraceae bacterium]
MRDERNMDTEKQTLKDKLMVIILLETAKDYKEMDSDLVTECVDFLMELEGKERLTKKEIEQRVKEIPFKGKVTALSSYAKRKIRAKRLAIIAAVLAVLIALFGIISIASGKPLDEIFRQIGNYLFDLSEGSSVEYDNITFITPNETKTYSSIEEFVKDEKIEILYPTWLPENEKIVKVWYLEEDNVKRYIMHCNTPEHSIDIDINSDLAETLKLNSVSKQIAGYSVYYIETEEYIQANFVYKNNIYRIKSDSEDNLFRIIENLKEIN